MTKLVIKEPNDGELETICTREYDADSFQVPERSAVVAIPDGDDEERYYVENVVHRLEEDGVELHLIVRDEEEVLRQVREQRAQKRRQMQQLQQAQGGGGGNPFGGGGGGGGGNGGGGSPFSL